MDRGHLPEGWELRKLSDFCTILTGKLNANAAVENGEYPFFTCSREIFSIDHFAFDCEAILLAGNNAVGDFNVKYYKGKFNAYQRTYVITIKKGEPLLYKYLYLQVESALKVFKIQSVGAGTKFLKLDMIKSLKINLPPINEQKQIVAILDEAFEGIDQAISNTEKNLANARELFESYLNKIFTQKDNGWEEKKLQDICNVKDGTHDSPKYLAEGIPFITQKNIRENGLTFENIKFISLDDHQKFYTRSNVAFGDILISMIGANRGMAAIVDDERIFSIKNVGLIKANDNVNKYFLLYFLKSNRAKNYVELESKGGAQPFIGLGKLREFPVIVAPQNKQDSIVIELDQLYLETKRLETIYRQKLAALNELKQSILQKAFTGQLTSKNC
jgi:type I restriction enzyme S subunit